MNRGSAKASPAGFTLIEIMLAVVIMGMILAMLAGAFSAVAHGKTHAENRLLADQAGRIIIWQMTKEIEGAARTIWPPDTQVLMIGMGHMGNGTPVDGLTISTWGAGHSRSVLGFGTENVVTYTAQPNPDHRGWYMLMRSQGNGLLPQGGQYQPQSFVIADNVLSLHIRYFNGQIWDESWDSRAQPPNNPFPAAVSIDLQLAAPGGRPMDFPTQIMVPMAWLQR